MRCTSSSRHPPTPWGPVCGSLVYLPPIILPPWRAKNGIYVRFFPHPRTSLRGCWIASQQVRTHPSRSERIRMGPNMSESFENLAKTSKNLAKTFTKFPKKNRFFFQFFFDEIFSSECIRMYPNVSECVKTSPNGPENVKKLRENVEKLRETVGVGGMAEPLNPPSSV